MMRVLLFDLTGNYAIYSTRLILALIRNAGHEAIFVCANPIDQSTEKEFAALDFLLKDIDVCMISVYSFCAYTAVQLSKYVHENFPRKPVIWGGPHCISEVESVLQFADGVCYSEGDVAVTEILNRMEAGEDYLSTPNMAFNTENGIQKNELLPPFTDLDSLPFPDFSLTNEYELINGELNELSLAKLLEHCSVYPVRAKILWIVTMRGCPYQCTYCNNIKYHCMYPKDYIRHSSVDRAMNELEHTTMRVPGLRWIGIGDDDFFLRPTKDIQFFAEEYRKRIPLPMVVQCSAPTFNVEKMEYMIHAGAKVISLGIQSASQRVLDEVFDRRITVKRVEQALEKIYPLQRKYGTYLVLDFIIDNPYETMQDILETYLFILSLPELPIRVNLFKLGFFPGTPIYDRAVQDGFTQAFITDEVFLFGRANVRYHNNFALFLIFFIRMLRRRRLNRYIPSFFMKLLAVKPVFSLIQVLGSPFWKKIIRRLDRSPIEKHKS